MALRLTLTDGSGVAGLQSVFGAFINTNVAATAADALAASNSATAALNSQNSATASAATATTQATAAAGSATAASGSASAAAGSASSAGTQATAASNSAAAALLSQQAAAGSASQAGTSATLAQAWAAQTTGNVNGTAFASAYQYAQQAANSAANAAGTLANALMKQNNLSDVANPATALNNLGGFPSAGGTITGAVTINGNLQANYLYTPNGFAVTGDCSITANEPNGANLKFIVDGANSKTFRGNGQYFQIMNAAYSAVIFQLDDSGNMTVPQRPTFNGNLAVDAGNIAALTPGKLLNVRVITTSQTYTPTAGTTSVIAIGKGAGGGGGGCTASNGTNSGASQCGGAGGLFVHRFTSGFSGLAITIGAAGAAGPATGGAGGNGGATSIGSVTANGGTGGAGSTVSNTGPANASGGTGGTATGANILNVQGNQGSDTNYGVSANYAIWGTGGNSEYGSGAKATLNTTPASATGYGAGGAGLIQTPAGTTARTGSAGSPGFLLLYEFA